MPETPASASRHYAQSALVARRAVQEAQAARPRGFGALLSVVLTHQIAQAQLSQRAIGLMLAEQSIRAPQEALLDIGQFTTAPDDLAVMVEQVKVDWEFDRLVESIVQDAGRAAESVSVATRDHVAHVRYLNPPSCGRCAVLAGRIYRWSTGFERHPGCDCVMVPTTVANDQLVQDPEDLARRGLVHGLSKADLKAVQDGADLGAVVNVRRKSAGLMEAGQALTRGGRPTPAGIYRLADGDQSRAIELLRANGYIR